MAANTLRLIEAIESGEDAKLEAVFAQDFKFVVPGTGGRESNDIPIPPGIDGSPRFPRYSDQLKQAGVKMFIGALHKGFSNIKWSTQKSIPEEEGGENIVASRAEMAGEIHNRQEALQLT